MSDDNEALIAELRSKHGKIEWFENDDGQLFVVTRPSRGAWKRYVNTVQEGTDPEQAQYDLAISATVHPPIDQLKKILSDYAATAVPLSEAATVLAKGGIKSLGKA